MDYQEEQQVIVTDIRMPFISMVVFMVKWVIASIPAFIILWLIGAFLMLALGGMMGGLNSNMSGGMWLH